MAKVPILNPTEWQEQLNRFSQGRSYFAMYSSVTGGITKDVGSMVIPLDDHMVHRGDGIFEALRIHHGALFDLDAHLSRLEISAKIVFLNLPMAIDKIRSILLETVAAAAVETGIVRIFVSRGPGNFSVSPMDTVGSQLYIVVTNFNPMSEQLYANGAKVIVAKMPQKPDMFARVKSCNYLPNVLMKREAVLAAADFSISLTEGGCVAEGSTENLMIVDGVGALVVPKFDYTLRGTTLLRVMDLARESVSEGLLSSVVMRDLHFQDLLAAREMAMVGTTLGVMPVRQISNEKESKSFAAPFVVANELGRRLRRLMDRKS